MDYLTVGLISLAVLMSIIALIMMYAAKPKDSSSSTRRFILPGVTRAASDQPTEELYTTSKINSAIGLTIAAIVFGIGGVASAAYNKKAALAKRIGTPIFRSLGVPTTVLS